MARTTPGLYAPSDARKHFVNLLHRCAIAATKPSTPDRIRLFTCATYTPPATYNNHPFSGARYPFRSADLCPVIATSRVFLFPRPPSSARDTSLPDGKLRFCPPISYFLLSSDDFCDIDSNRRFLFRDNQPIRDIRPIISRLIFNFNFNCPLITSFKITLIFIVSDMNKFQIPSFV